MSILVLDHAKEWLKQIKTNNNRQSPAEIRISMPTMIQGIAVANVALKRFSYG